MTTLLTVLFSIALILLGIIYCRPKTNAPLVNPAKLHDVFSTTAKLNFILNAKTILKYAREKYSDKSYRVIGDVGEVIILPPQLAQHIRNDDRFDFIRFTERLFLPKLHGLEAFAAKSEIINTVIQRHLTKFLDSILDPLHEETISAITETFTKGTVWHPIQLRDAVLRIVARVSSRVFLGQELCRNEQWLTLIEQYATAGFRAAEEMRKWPEFIRPILALFHPSCRRAARIILDARAIMGPIIEQRHRERASPDYVPYNDAIEWIEHVANGQAYDPVLSQLTLSVVAIHTSTDLLCQAISDIARNGDIIQALRKEISECIAVSGWNKSALYNMKLLDSCVKESQRMKPTAIVGMRRFVSKNVHLPDGTFVPKGSMVAVSAHRMWDPKVHENPEIWDGYRFVRMRAEENRENVAQLVSTSPDHLAFGHGRHACPGRFFAANEIKMILASIFIDYDVKFANGRVPEVRRFGFGLATDPTIDILVRARQDNTD